MTAPRTLPRLTCWQTGTVTSACLASPSGACGPCGRLAAGADTRLRLAALLDERALLAGEDFR